MTEKAQEWFWSHVNDERFRKHICASLAAWAALYAVFLIEISSLNMNSQGAKLTMTPLGIPVGLLVQWFVFGDKVIALKTRFSLKKIWLFLGSRWAVAKVLFFVANQVIYAVLLHEIGFPAWAAAIVAAPFVSITYYYVTNRWVIPRQSAKKTDKA